MTCLLILLAPILLTPTCSGGGPGFGGSGSPAPSDPVDTAPPDDDGGGGMEDCEAEYTTLSHTGAACDKPHTLDFECVYMLSNDDCSYEYSP